MIVLLMYELMYESISLIDHYFHRQIYAIEHFLYIVIIEDIMKCDRYLSKRAIILHEHDFNSVYIAGKRIFRCLTCGSLYCERCGKLVLCNKEAKYHSHESPSIIN